MLITKLALVAATLTTSATAAFFYVPEYRCDLDGSCTEDKRSVEADVQPSTFNLVQRGSENASPRNIPRIAEGLRRKHRRTTTRQAGYVEDESLIKRSNTHSVVTAAVPSQTNSAGVDQDGTDYSYFVQVGMGSANTPVYLLLDTGSGSIWVMGNSCTSSACKTHDTFGSSSSTTFKDLNTPFSVAYGSGDVNGSLAQDSLSIAGMKLTATIGIASTATDAFNAFPIDGILGLSLSKSDNNSFWSSLATSKALKANIFGLSIKRNSDGPNTGEINFGAPDTSRYSGSLSYSACVSGESDDWAIQMNNVAFGSSSTGISSTAIIDTGTSFIFAPPADAKTLHASIPGASSSDGSTWTVPCTTTTPLVFTFGTSSYSVSSKDWVSAPSNGVCTSNVYGISVVDDVSWLVGDTFLKNVYAVFDFDQSRIGLAQANGASSSSSTTASSTGGSSISALSSHSVSSMASSTASAASASAASASATATGTKSDGNISGSSAATATGSTPTSVASGSTSSSTLGPLGLAGNIKSSTTAGSTPTGTSTSASSSGTNKPGASSAALISPSLCSYLFATGALIAMFF